MPWSTLPLPILVAGAILGAACSSPPHNHAWLPPEPPPLEPTADEAPPGTTDPVLGGDDHAGIESLDCYTGDSGCAAAGPFIEGTCCTVGDNLVHLATATANEAVDIEFDGEHVYACGGFGVRISDVTEPSQPAFVGSATSRCQRIGLGPTLEDGTRVFWLAHHGDTWVDEPFLQAWHLRPDNAVVFVTDISEPGVRFEGLLFHEGFLYAATHAEGLRIYGVDGDGKPTLARLVTGFDNAQKIAAQGDRLYVTDDAEVVVVDIRRPTEASIVGSVTTTGTPRDVTVLSDRLYVALGARGVDVFEESSDELPVLLRTLPTDGSSQAVAGYGNLLAVADWSHVSLYDARSLRRVATERNTPYPNFEQDLGIAIGGDSLFVAEWESVHVLEFREGMVGPDIFVGDDLYAFPGDETTTRTVEVKNRGSLDLSVSRIEVTDPAWTTSEDELLIAPGGTAEFELTYTPPPPTTTVQSLVLISDDPDELQAPLQIPLHAIASAQADVGDSVLIEEFAFLDPTGAGDVQNLRGHVIVLAYFALF